MNNILIDIFPILLLIIVLIGTKPILPLSKINDDYLSIDNLKYYKGFFAIFVIFHHLAQHTQGGLLFPIFLKIGYLAVALFFFYSGFGLQKSYMLKGENYRKDFLKKRIPTVLFPYIIVTVLYWLINLIGGNLYSFKDIIFLIIKGKPIVWFSWYVITIIIYYFVYWLLMTICKNNYKAMIIGGTLWYVLYIILCIKLGYGSWWYNTSHMLIIGMIWALYENKITKKIEKHQIFIPIMWILFIIVFIFNKEISLYFPFKEKELLIKMITTILFMISVLLFSMKVKIKNKVLSFFGEISFELYMIQGLFIKIFSKGYINIENGFIKLSLVLILSIFSAYVLHIIFNKLLTKYKQLVKV